MDEAKFNGSNLIRASFKKAILPKAEFGEEAVLEGADLSEAELREVCFDKANLKKANLAFAKLRKANFHQAQLDQATLENSDLTGADFLKMKITANTNLSRIRFEEDHNVNLDNSDTILLPHVDRIDWEKLRYIGDYPLFGVSWTAFAISLTVINSIGFLNDSKIMTTIKEYPIPIPERMIWILISCLLLVVGSTLFKFFCPPEVKHFSEAQWVEQHRKPRLIYISHKIKRRWARVITATFLGIGSFMAAWLILEKFYRAIRYSILQF